jgi:hypothetical protein
MIGYTNSDQGTILVVEIAPSKREEKEQMIKGVRGEDSLKSKNCSWREEVEAVVAVLLVVKIGLRLE